MAAVRDAKARWATVRGAKARGASFYTIARQRLAKLGAFAAPAGHVAWLDGWRGVCIAMVLLGHFMGYYLGPLAPLGVEMFFVLSGRLMAEVLIVRRQPLATFVQRRVSRIVPLLALYTGIVGIGLAAAALVAGTPVNWLSIPAALLFFINYVPHPAALLEHSWTLAVEEHSYIVLLLVAAVSARKPRTAFWIATLLAGGMALVGVILFYKPFDTGHFDVWRSDVRGASVLLSFALCLAMRRWRPDALPGGPVLRWLAPMCVIGAVACRFFGDPWTPLQSMACASLAAIAVNTIQVSSPHFQRLLSLRVLTWLGTLSFSVYIWQQPFFLAVLGGFPVAIAVPLTFVCAIWSFARVEAPARRYLNARSTGAQLRSSERHAGRPAQSLGGS